MALASRVAQWSKALAVPPETLGLSPGSVAAGRNREVHGATHNWPSIVWVREGLAGSDILVSSRTSDSCGGPGAVQADQVARCTVFPPTHWCGWLDGWSWICVVSSSSAAWLGCVSEEARLLVGLCFGGHTALGWVVFRRTHGSWLGCV
jgi:hypothetical protein